MDKIFKLEFGTIVINKSCFGYNKNAGDIANGDVNGAEKDIDIDKNNAKTIYFHINEK